MTADLTPAQAARLEEIEAAPWAEEAVERVARVLWETQVGFVSYTWTEIAEGVRAYFRTLAVAAIDVMRGATDDGAVGAA